MSPAWQHHLNHWWLVANSNIGIIVHRNMNQTAKNFHCIKCFWKYHLQNDSHFVSASIYQLTKDMWHKYASETAFSKQGKSEEIDSCVWPRNLKWDPNRIFSTVTFKFGTSSMLLEAVLFQSHPWIQIWIWYLKTLKSEPNCWFVGPCELVGWPKKIIGHLYMWVSVHETVGHDQVAHKIGCLCISL